MDYPRYYILLNPGDFEFYDEKENLCFDTINIITFLTDKNSHYTFDYL